MADPKETQLLDSINKHLNAIKMKGDLVSNPDVQQKAFESSVELFAEKIVNAIRSNQSDLDSKYQQVFGDMQGFNIDQTNIISDDLANLDKGISVQNDLIEQQFENKFLEEKRQEEVLNVDKERNDLLEDILEKEDEAQKDSSGFFDRAMGFFTGALSAGGLKKIMSLFTVRNLGRLAGFVAFPLLALFGIGDFLKGWQEAGDEATTSEKLNFAVSKVLSKITFGIVPEKIFRKMFSAVSDKIKEWWGKFTKKFSEYMNGELSGSELLDTILSDLTGGAVTPEEVAKIRGEISSGIQTVVDVIVKAIVDTFIKSIADAVKAKLKLLITDPKAFFNPDLKKSQDDLEKTIAKEAEESGVATSEIVKGQLKTAIEKRDAAQKEFWDKEPGIFGTAEENEIFQAAREKFEGLETEVDALLRINKGIAKKAEEAIKTPLMLEAIKNQPEAIKKLAEESRKVPTTLEEVKQSNEAFKKFTKAILEKPEPQVNILQQQKARNAAEEQDTRTLNDLLFKPHVLVRNGFESNP